MTTLPWLPTTKVSIMRIDQLLNWYLAMAKNLQQMDCKLFYCLRLAVSKMYASVGLKPIIDTAPSRHLSRDE
jgi:hypothetical protein